MTAIGYARVSTTDQDCAIQEAALRAAGCDVVRSERKSGTTTAGRGELATVLEFLRPGDTLVVTRIDRLARSVGDLVGIVNAVETKGATLRATEQPIDTSSAAGKAFLQMLGVFAEFEHAIRKERQSEGIAKAKAAGAYKGRKPSVAVERVRRLHADGMGPAQIARTLGIGRTSVYRALDDSAPSAHPVKAPAAQ
jgi:DNA invertase Pin-like site-specific DNA recombinase